MVFFDQIDRFLLVQDTSGLRLVANGPMASSAYFQFIVRGVCFNPTIFSPIKLLEKIVTKFLFPGKFVF